MPCAASPAVQGETFLSASLCWSLPFQPALAYDAKIILADEPTGNLDTETQSEIMAIFRKLAADGRCVILVSHSPDVANCCDECYELKKTPAKSKSKIRSNERIFLYIYVMFSMPLYFL